MEKIRKLDKESDIECDRDDCPHTAVTRIKTKEGAALRLCVKHEEEYAEELREKIQEKYSDMSKDEIAEKLMQGEGIL